MKTRFFALLALVVGLVAPASAQNKFGIGGGYDFDVEDPFLTAQVRTSQLSSVPLRFNPELNVFFIDNLTAFQVNGNLLYDFGVNNVAFTPYAGVGLGIGYVKPDAGDSNTELGANFLFGAEFGGARLRPYAQVQFSTTDVVSSAIAGGVLFTF